MRLRQDSAVLLGFTLLLGLFLLVGLGLTHGQISYTLDDPFIHLAIAKQLIAHGVWGVSPYQFSSSSSSILWPILLALGGKIGFLSWWPLILNWLIATFLLGWLARQSREMERYHALFLVFFLLTTSLPYLVFSGMEHILHLALTLWLCSVTRDLCQRDRPNNRQTLLLLILGTLVVMTRYEAIPLIFLLSGVLLSSRRRQGWLLPLALTPILLFGLFSLNGGGYFFPNSVLLKSLSPNLTSSAEWLRHYGKSLEYITQDWLICALILLHLLHCLEPSWRSWNIDQKLSAVFLICTTLHLVNAVRADSWSNRYTAYLIGMGLYLLLRASWYPLQMVLPSPQRLSMKRRVVLFGVVLIPMLLQKWITALTPIAMMNIYEQQQQMGHFLAQHYSGAAVVANDIGAINYFADLHCLDYVGLGDNYLAEVRYERKATSELYRAYFDEQGARIAVVYDSWVEGSIGRIPENWILVGRWAISHNVAAAHSVVSFYAIGEQEVEPLIENLEHFASQLPPRVQYGLAPQFRESLDD